jgi:hypothetical protein
MRKTVARRLILFSALSLFALLAACSSDEKTGPSGPPASELMLVEFRNPVEIEVNSELQLALLLHDRTSPTGTALQLIDLQNREVISTIILDYYDVYDVEFISATEACFVGRPQGNTGYAIEFFNIPDLTMISRVMIAGLTGSHGYLDVNGAGTIVYYSHAGGEDHDAVYALSTAAKLPIDADNDDIAPFGFDNELVDGLLNQPGRIFFDDATEKIVVANLNGDFITLIDESIWGTLSRTAGVTFPVSGTSHLTTQQSEVSDVRADAVAFGGPYAFAGTSAGTPYLSRFGTESQGLDFIESFPDRQWAYRNRDIRIHPRQDIFSVFIMEEDSIGFAIGQFRLNNLGETASSPYRTRHIADSTIAAVGLDTENDRLLVADKESERLEFITVYP